MPAEPMLVPSNPPFRMFQKRSPGLRWSTTWFLRRYLMRETMVWVRSISRCDALNAALIGVLPHQEPLSVHRLGQIGHLSNEPTVESGADKISDEWHGLTEFAS